MKENQDMTPAEKAIIDWLSATDARTRTARRYAPTPYSTSGPLSLRGWIETLVTGLPLDADECRDCPECTALRELRGKLTRDDLDAVRWDGVAAAIPTERPHEPTVPAKTFGS